MKLNHLKMQTKAKLILLPQNKVGWEKGDIITHPDYKNIGFANFDSKGMLDPIDKRITAQHLYLITTSKTIKELREIKEGCYSIFSCDGTISLFKLGNHRNKFFEANTLDNKKMVSIGDEWNYPKVLASTNSELNLPNISPEFIQQWIDGGYQESCEVKYSKLNNKIELENNIIIRDNCVVITQNSELNLPNISPEEAAEKYHENLKIFHDNSIEDAFLAGYNYAQKQK